MPRPFRFGVQVRAAADASGWAAMAHRAEELGYSTLLVPDHLSDQFAVLPAIMAAALATETLRIGPLVLDNDFRHPALLAKELATIDLLSGGRLEVGLGAGWRIADYEQSGISMDSAGTRIERMVEAVTVLKGLWSDGAFHHQGVHYSLGGLDGFPKPVQRPHPPILIGGGARRMLTAAARTADIVGINPSLHAGEFSVRGSVTSSFAVDVPERIGWVREAAGSRFDAIELNAIVFLGVHIVEDRERFATELATRLGLEAEDLLGSPYALIGTHDEVVQQLSDVRRRWGISYLVVQGQDQMEDLGPVVASLSGR